MARRNVEIKARVTDLKDLKAKALDLCDDNKETLLEQEDTFFKCNNGRLKLRQCKGEVAILIHYNRSDQSGPKLSDFHITVIEHPEDLKLSLTRALGVRGVVKKRRFLYMVGQTRIHVDCVESLGDFMELEVMLEDDQTVENGERIANDLMNKLGISSDDLMTCAYMDMILDREDLEKKIKIEPVS